MVYYSFKGRDYMANAYLTYAITEIFCCIFALILLFHLDASLGSEHEVRQLKNLIYCYLIFVVTDIFWALTEGQIIEPPHYLNAAVNAVSVASVVMGCLQWFWFVTERLNPGREYADYIHVLSAIPAIAVILMDVISIFTGWIFFIDRNNHYVTTDLFAVQAMGTYLYLIAAAVLSFVHLVRPHSGQQKSEFLMYSVLMIPVMAAGFFEDLIPFVPILAMCIFLMLYLLFLTLTQEFLKTADELIGNETAAVFHETEFVSSVPCGENAESVGGVLHDAGKLPKRHISFHMAEPVVD